MASASWKKKKIKKTPSRQSFVGCLKIAYFQILKLQKNVDDVNLFFLKLIKFYIPLVTDSTSGYKNGLENA